MRVAAIDIGSNSIRLMIVDVPVGGRRVTLDEEKVYARLGRGVHETGLLSAEAMDVAVTALDRMVRLARERSATHIRAVATAAVREAANGAAFVERVRREAGLEIDVISGEHEGRLALLSAVDSLALSGEVSVVDIGGGSVEVVHATGTDVETAVSMPLGVVVLSDRFGGDPMSAETHDRLTAHVRGTLDRQLSPARRAGVLAGSGGTITTLAVMIAAEQGVGLSSVHGFEIAAADLHALRSRLVRSTARERMRMNGLSQSRMDLIVCGSVVLDEIVSMLGADGVVVNAHGMREGIVLEVIEQERGPLPVADRMRSVRELGRRYGYDAAHAEHVRHLALRLFDDLASELDLDPEGRPLLEAAALLHDVGYHVAHAGHHKHSHHLIVHADIPGFSAREVRVIAAVARYHKGALPRSGHEALESLDPGEVALVSQLSAILRLADGLDRSGGQRVHTVSASITDGRLLLRIGGREPLDIEVDGAARKADLAERVWGVKVDVLGHDASQ